MADDKKYYAWSNFRLEMNEWGQVTEWLRVGEEVTKEKLGLTDDAEWQALVDGGAVRTEPYPDLQDMGTAPAQAPVTVEEKEAPIKELRMNVPGSPAPQSNNPPAPAAAPAPAPAPAPKPPATPAPGDKK